MDPNRISAHNQYKYLIAFTGPLCIRFFHTERGFERSVSEITHRWPDVVPTAAMWQFTGQAILEHWE